MRYYPFGKYIQTLGATKMDEEVLKSCSCPLDATLAVIGGKYKIDIIYYLIGRTLRYNQLAKLVSATPKMLAEQLKELERDGIINRVLYPVVPPKTEYSLTPLGNKMCAAVYEMYKFGNELFRTNRMKPHCGCKEDLSRLEEALNIDADGDKTD